MAPEAPGRPRISKPGACKRRTIGRGRGRAMRRAPDDTEFSARAAPGAAAAASRRDMQGVRAGRAECTVYVRCFFFSAAGNSTLFRISR